jgi:hypothetical protein
MPAIGAVYIGTRISTSTFTRLERIAAREQNGVSAVVRRLLSAALDAEDQARGVERTRPKKKTRRVA